MLALDPDLTAALLDDPVHHGQLQPRHPSLLLPHEGRLEEVTPSVFIHHPAGGADRQQGILPRTDAGVRRGREGRHAHVGGLDGQRSPLGHGLP